MKDMSPGNYKKTALLFIIILLIFLVSADILLLKKLRTQILNEEYIDAQQEMDMVALFLREPMLMKNYDEVEQFLIQWRDEHNDIVSIEAILPNGFKLVEPTDKVYGTGRFELKKNIQYLGNDMMSIRVVRVYMHTYIMKSLQLQLIIGSIILTFFFGLMLWYTIKKYALTPLETEWHNLEDVVLKHTKTWEEANINLLSEIDIRKKTQTQLKAKIKELEEFYDMAVGREIKLKLLKDEIAKLKKEVKTRAADRS